MKSDYLKALLDGELEKAEYIRRESIPEKLIKFIWLDGSETDEKKFQTLRNNELWFSHLSQLNDPFEFKGMYLDRNKLEAAGYPKKTIEVFEVCFDILEVFGITCFSANDIDYLPMWAYYTNNYRGFCVEYEVVDPDKIYEVSYEPERIATASLFLSYFNAVKKSEGQSTPEADHSGSIFKSIFYMKSEDWAHEKEYRIVSPVSNTVGENKRIDELGLRVTKIVAGLKSTEEDKATLNEISNELGCGNIFISTESSSTYGLEVRRLSSAGEKE